MIDENTKGVIEDIVYNIFDLVYSFHWNLISLSYDYCSFMVSELTNTELRLLMKNFDEKYDLYIKGTNTMGYLVEIEIRERLKE